MHSKSREDRISVFCRFAQDLATLSKCTERQVAAIITDYNLTQILSIGINGGPAGGADCACVTEGKYGCLHAEINALIKCQYYTEYKCMFLTLSPCKQCATAIINAPGIFTHIYYIEEWKETEGIVMLDEAGIIVEQISKEVLNGFSN